MDYQSHKMTDIKIKRNASPTQSHVCLPQGGTDPSCYTNS